MATVSERLHPTCRGFAAGWVACAFAVSAARTQEVNRSPQWEVMVGPAARWGTLRYEIGGRYRDATTAERLPFPISRLDWPGETIRVEARGQWRSGDGRWQLEAASTATAIEREGVMKDSDWEYAPAGRALAVYSESDTLADCQAFEAAVRWWPVQWQKGRDRFGLAMGLGWRREHWDWEARDGIQWYPAYPAVPPDVWSGTVVEYSVDMDFPYGELAVEAGRGAGSVWGSLAISPIARIEDRDDHRLRGILAKADTDGAAARLKFGVRYAWARRWTLEAGVAWVGWATEGTSHNKIYSDEEGAVGEEWWIEEEIRARFFDAWVVLGVRF